MITFFTIPRPFVDEFDKLQRAAIASWRGAVPDCHIDLLGNDATVRYAAIDFGTENGVYYGRNWCKLTSAGRPVTDANLFHVMDIYTSEYFETPWLCFTSADIIFGADLRHALEACEQIDRPFVVGQRWDIEPGASRESAKLHPPCGVDYFFYKPGTINTADIPPFIVSGGGGDNWFVWKAVTAWDMMVIDATAAITAIHINHGHPEWEYGKAGRQGSPEQDHNKRLWKADGMTRPYGVDDAPWVLGTDGVLRERVAA